MKKVNFDSLTNLKAPKSFIENAINATKTQNKKPLVFIKYSRALAAVACLVIVCAVSLGVYFKEYRVTPPIDPSFIVETGNSKDSENTQYTDKNIKETLKNDKDFDKENAQNSVTNNKPTTESETIEPSEKPSSTTKPTEDSKDEPTVGPTKPSESAKPSESTNTNEIPTSSPPLKPGTNPTTKPTKPSDKPKPTLPDSSSQDPNYPAVPPPEQSKPSDGTNPTESIFYTSFPSNLLAGTAIVFCSVEDPSGNIVVSKDTAFVYSISNGLAYISYDLSDSAITTSGMYLCHFYLKDGTHICSSAIHIRA